MRIPGASRRSDEIVRKTSGRHAGGGYLTAEFSSDEPGPEDLRLTLAYGGLHIARRSSLSTTRACLPRASKKLKKGASA